MDQRRKYRAARETFQKGNTQRSNNSLIDSSSKAGRNKGLSNKVPHKNYDEYDLYESRDIEEFTSSDLNTLITPNPLQTEKQQFSSIANQNDIADYNNTNNVLLSSNTTKINNAIQKKTSGNLTIHMPSNMPNNVKSNRSSSNTSSNVSTPFAQLPKFKANSSDDDGSESEYSGEIKYYDLNKVVQHIIMLYSLGNNSFVYIACYDIARIVGKTVAAIPQESWI